MTLVCQASENSSKLKIFKNKVLFSVGLRTVQVGSTYEWQHAQIVQDKVMASVSECLPTSDSRCKGNTGFPVRQQLEDMLESILLPEPSISTTRL